MTRIRKIDYLAHTYLKNMNLNVVPRAYQMFGVKGTQELTVLNAYHRNYPSVLDAGYIECTGKLKGFFSLSELVDEGQLLLDDSSEPDSTNALHINSLSQAFPHVPFLYVSFLPYAYRATFSTSTTSLPPKLQYAYAAALPLGPKTRRAHKHWFDSMCKELDLGFYERQLVYEGFISKLTRRCGIQDRLKEIESSLTLTIEEAALENTRNADYFYDANKSKHRLDCQIAKHVQSLKRFEEYIDRPFFHDKALQSAMELYLQRIIKK